MIRESFILLLACSAVYSKSCNLPPRLWCSSEETARNCGVEKQCASYNAISNSVEATPPVQVTLYFESLCPGCRGFIKSQLYPTFQILSNSNIMNVTLVPYGNAHESKVGDKWNYECQHGENECIGNFIETCLLHYNGMKTAFPVLACMEDIGTPYDPQILQQCASQYSVDYQTVLKCSNSSLGNSLEHEMAEKTDALNPPHTYVPWVTVNGVHTEEIQQEATADLLKLVCDTYTGPKPPACTALMDVCYRQ
ncbi:gamma-interferon-inducible lysosomal thiol reductase-like [Glandiceps talaboti]